MTPTASKRSAGRRVPPKKVPMSLETRWVHLHRGDLEPFPDEPRVKQLAKKYPSFASYVEKAGGTEALAQNLQTAWQEYHDGEFLKAISLGDKLGPLGASVANKAAAVHALNAGHNESNILAILTNAMTRGEKAVQMLPDYANAHYNYALILGRYSQRISILKALAEGLAGKVREHLERTLKIEPKHAEAHIAMGLYHAEIIGKLGTLAARLTYNASTGDAISHFQRAIKLTPDSPIALMEYANGLLLLDARANQDQARHSYAQAANLDPADAMEKLDVARAKRGIP